MNPSTTRISLGIAIYLSSSLIYSSASFAVSLEFSDRYELTNVEEPFLAGEFFDISYSNPDFELQQQSQGSLTTIESNPLQQPQGSSAIMGLNPLQQPQSSSSIPEYSNSQLLISYLSPEAFSTSTLNIQIQTNTTELEDINLLSYLTNALGNLQFDSIGNNSFVNPNVIILPQVAYENIYRGLYDFDISLVTPRVPRTINSVIAEDTLISRESISNFSSTFASPSSFGNSYITSNNTNSLYSNSSSVEPFYNSTNTQVSNSIYDNLSNRLESVLSENTNVYTNKAAINQASNSEFVTATEKFNSQKDRQLRELERERDRQDRIRTQRRQVLERQLQQEQMQRERERKRELITSRKRRENELRRQIQRQKVAQKRQ